MEDSACSDPITLTASRTRSAVTLMFHKVSQLLACVPRMDPASGALGIKAEDDISSRTARRHFRKGENGSPGVVAKID